MGKFTVAALIALTLGACSRAPNAGSFTLYREQAGGAGRVTVATFEAEQGSDYNHDNCERARELFLAQPGVAVRYWCEAGKPG